MNITLNETKITQDSKNLAFEKNSGVDEIVITVDTDETWSYKLDVKYPDKYNIGNDALYNVIDLNRNGDICSVILTSKMLPFNGKYTMQLRGIKGDKVYHSDTFEVWVKYSIEPRSTYDPVPSEFYQVEARLDDKVNEAKQYAENAEIASTRMPKISPDNTWLIWDAETGDYVDTGIVASGGTTDHSKLINRSAADQHPMSAITGLEKALESKQPAGAYLTDKDLDTTLKETGKAADASEVGKRLSSLSEEIADLSTLTLGVHTDGLVYIFLNGVPVGTGVKIDGSIVVDGDTVELSDGITLTTLMFSDDFEGDTLSDVWKPSYGYDNAALNSWWTANEKNLGVADSCVRFTMLRDNPTDDFAISAAKIETMQHGTANNYGFDTGYCEVRFKLDKVGAGIWPAIWCVGQTQTDEYTNITATSVTRTLHGRTWPWAGEIDQLDGIGSAFTPGLIYQTDQYVSSVLTMKGSQKVTLEADTWHTIGVYKTKDVIKIYWDRELIDTFDISGIDCFSGMGERLILNLATGKNLGGALPDDISEVNMFVDYVKVYSLSNTFTTLADQNTATLLPDYADGFACVSGRNFLLHPQFAENTQNTALYWGSSNAAVAKVENGYVTTVANGECTISATDADGNKVISFPMTVKANAGILATAIKITTDNTAIDMGETLDIEAHIYPTNCDSLTPTLSVVSGSEYCTINGLTIMNTNTSGANQDVIVRVGTNNPNVYEDVTLQVVGRIVDNIDTNGIVAKYTRKGWSADAWTSDLETNPAVAATNNDANGWTYTAGLGYKKAYNSGSVATIGTDLFNIDGPFTLVSRMHYAPGANISSGGNAFEVINSDDSGAGNIEPNVGQNRLYMKDATATNRQIGSFFGDTSRDTTDGATYNVVLVKDESRNLTVYINGVKTAQSTYYSTVDPMGLTGMVFRFPKGSVYAAYYQAMLAYNRAMTAEEIVALHTALEEMYA